MATVYNNTPTTTDSNNSSMGLLVGILIVLAIIVLAVLFLMPGLRGGTATDSGSSSSVNLPDKVDVNVNGGGSQPGTGQ